MPRPAASIPPQLLNSISACSFCLPELFTIGAVLPSPLDVVNAPRFPQLFAFSPLPAAPQIEVKLEHNDGAPPAIPTTSGLKWPKVLEQPARHAHRNQKSKHARQNVQPAPGTHDSRQPKRKGTTHHRNPCPRPRPQPTWGLVSCKPSLPPLPRAGIAQAPRRCTTARNAPQAAALVQTSAQQNKPQTRHTESQESK